MKFKTIEWKGDRVRILDQRRLPGLVRHIDCNTASSVAKAIREMAIRGAPAIGVAAAMGIALAGQKIRTDRPALFLKEVDKVCRQMGQTRPTAVNLFWAIRRMRSVLGRSAQGIKELRAELIKEALAIYREDIEVNRSIGEKGQNLIQDGAGILTHCNAGALATAGYGTALGVMYAARDQGKRFHVFVDETRPLLQGCRLTAWELVQEKIPATVITDNMAGVLMASGKIDLVIVGADRIARNGDTANKIGTYGLAVLSKWHGIPLYVAAPISTIDFGLDSGTEIPIEERGGDEVTHIGGKRIAPTGIKVFNPAFDVTPHSLIAGIITEKGIIRPPFNKSIIRDVGSKAT